MLENIIYSYLSENVKTLGSVFFSFVWLLKGTEQSLTVRC